MEDERSFGSGFSDVETSGAVSRRLPPVVVTAGVCVFVLILAIGWSISEKISAAHQALTAASAPHLAQTPSTSGTDGSSTPTQADVSQVGSAVMSALTQDYVSLESSGEYTPQAGAAIGQQLAAQVSAPVPAETFTASEIKTTSDTSYQRMMQYRADLQETLGPIASGTQPEITPFAEYVETGDTSYLTQLDATAEQYEAVASATAAVVTPQDAVSVQVGILNAMEQFAAVLQALAQNATDPVTSAVLLESYEQAENQMFSSFNALAQYYANHSNP